MENKHDRMRFYSTYSSKAEKKHMRDVEVKRLMALGHTKKFARQAARRV
ncbi:hypothetical protein JNG76_18285 [Proteus mirabilis]|nr:hypothetical protein [Proteus mirabilis]MCI9769117.1 hypothetical protein [Proteus mirabilis]MCI9772710.1 hypothetical protein [Proteus mirabilis]MCI9776300.1 hypothetical protein [Proteus mirabilis]MCW9724683.1 hypothetical protein [Proteus mirabilis]HAT4490357.1 hypothetical protein [Proteus mirabilis]